VVGCAAIAACAPPAWRDPARSKGTAELAPQVLEAAAADRPARPRTPGKHVTSAPLPPPPAWAIPLIGQQLRVAFPKAGACTGNVDAIRQRYTGPAAGAELSGWAWDPAARAAPPRVVLVDDNYAIQGAGEVGLPRPRVPLVRPDVTSPNVGWEAITSRVAGPLTAWAVLADGQSICKVGVLEL